jgi:hypothetical protein
VTTNVLDHISEEKILKAIRLGVRDAMWRMIVNGTNLPTIDFFEAMKLGVFEAMPPGIEIAEAIAKGVSNSMPHKGESPFLPRPTQKSTEAA